MGCIKLQDRYLHNTYMMILRQEETRNFVATCLWSGAMFCTKGCELQRYRSKDKLKGTVPVFYEYQSVQLYIMPCSLAVFISYTIVNYSRVPCDNMWHVWVPLMREINVGRVGIHRAFLLLVQRVLWGCLDTRDTASTEENRWRHQIDYKQITNQQTHNLIHIAHITDYHAECQWESQKE